MRLWKLILSALGKYVLMPCLMGLIGLMIVGRVINWFQGPPEYKIYLVGDEDKSPLFKGLWKALSNQQARIDDVPIKLETLDDNADPHDAERVSAEIVRRNDALLVIGHLRSSTTRVALPNYLLHTSPPLLTILTVETNPDLLPATVAGSMVPVIRLSPNDNQQAETGAAYIRRDCARPCNVWVIEDPTNQVYSSYLANAFITQVESPARVVLRSTTTPLPDTHTLEALQIRWVFFAGGSSNAVILLRLLRQLPALRHVNVMLSDASADKRLQTLSRDELLNVVLLHPLHADELRDVPAFYGQLAQSIIDHIMLRAGQRFAVKLQKRSRIVYWFHRLANIHRVHDARYVINEVRNDMANAGENIAPHFRESVRIEADGSRRDTHFHVLSVSNDGHRLQFRDLPELESQLVRPQLKRTPVFAASGDSVASLAAGKP